MTWYAGKNILPQFIGEPRQSLRFVVFVGKERLKNPEALAKS